MTTAAKKTPKSHSASVARTDSFFKGAQSRGFFSPVMRKASGRAEPTSGLSVSKPSDPLEREADRVADRVMRTAAEPTRPTLMPGSGAIQRFGVGTPAVAADALSDVRRETTGGTTLPHDVRGFMEPRLGADLGAVRVHTDETAASLSNHLSARAFTYQNHVFFARDQYQPGTTDGRHLLAHELTHTLQQGATKGVALSPGVDVQRSAQTPAVGAAGSTPAVQRLGVRDVLDYFADKAYYIPGFRMLTLLLGFNPVNMRSTARTAANFLRALVELVPGGAVITRVLDNHGVVNRAAEWVEQKLAALGDVGGAIVAGLRRFVDSLSWTDVLHPGDVWDRAKAIFTDPIDRLISFGTGVVRELLDLVKQAILRPLAALAQGTSGYDLLKAILGQDPITGEPVPRTADTLIGGFMKLIGQEEVWQNIKKGNAVARAFAWFQGALAGLMAFVRSVPGRVVATLRSLTFEDVLTVVGAFRKVGAAFLDLATEFGSWAVRQVLSLLEILFSVVAPGVMPYVAKAKTAFATIVRNPVAFLGNLVRAAKLGFESFASNILTHLKDSLIKWITGPLGAAGVYIPTSFSLLEVVKLVLSVLGLTWQNVRRKLLRIIPEPVLVALEKTASILVTLATQGPAAAWEQVKAELTELKDQLIGKVTQMVQTEVVKAAVKKLASMLNPVGAVIQAIVAIYDTVTFFVEKARQIGAVVASLIDSIAAIAAGQVGAAAKKVEETLAGTLTTVIAFLAKFAGLGNIPEKLVGIVAKVRAPIDRGLDKIVDWLGAMLQKLIGAAKAGARKLLAWWKRKVPVTGGDEPHVLTFDGERASAKLMVHSTPEKPSDFLVRVHKRSSEAGDAKALDQYVKVVTPLESGVEKLQKDLAEIDDNDKAAARGTKKDDANELSEKLDGLLTSIAKVIGKALAAWDVKEAMVGEFKIDRTKFTVTQKQAIADEIGRENFVPDSKGREINVRPKIDRRHVVSSDDIAKHYETFLKDKKLSEAKLLLEQRGSIADARTPVVTSDKKLTKKLIWAGAKTRYKQFFGYVKNIFLGGSSENRSIQEAIDTGNRELAGRKLKDHVDRIKRGWALDSSFEATGESDI